MNETCSIWCILTWENLVENLLEDARKSEMTHDENNGVFWKWVCFFGETWNGSGHIIKIAEKLNDVTEESFDNKVG